MNGLIGCHYHTESREIKAWNVANNMVFDRVYMIYWCTVPFWELWSFISFLNITVEPLYSWLSGESLSPKFGKSQWFHKMLYVLLSSRFRKLYFSITTHDNNRKVLTDYVLFIRLLQWRYNERHSVSNHQHLDWLLSRLFRRTAKKIPKPRFTGLCEGNPPVIGGSL